MFPPGPIYTRYDRSGRPVLPLDLRRHENLPPAVLAAVKMNFVTMTRHSG
jgi:hypothetical protein